MAFMSFQYLECDAALARIKLRLREPCCVRFPNERRRSWPSFLNPATNCPISRTAFLLHPDDTGAARVSFKSQGGVHQGSQSTAAPFFLYFFRPSLARGPGGNEVSLGF